MDIVTIVATVLTILLGVTAFSFISSKVKKVLAEVKDVLTAVLDALEDNKVTAEEIDKIVKEAKEVYTAIKEKEVK